MTCNFCGTTNKSGRTFCWKCGKPLPYEPDLYQIVYNFIKIIFQ